MAKGKKKKKDRRKHARAVGAAGGVGAFAGTFAGKVLERLLVQHATRFIDQFSDGRRKGKHDWGTRVLLALAEAPGPVSLEALVMRLKGDVLETVDTVHKLRRARLVKYADGRRAVHLTQQGRELLAGIAGRGADEAADGTGVTGDGQEDGQESFDGDTRGGDSIEAPADSASARADD